MKELLRKENVVAVGRGHKIVNGADTGREAIVVCVKKKIPVSALKKSQIVPATYRGIETDIVETGEIRALRTAKHRPAPGGVSIGHFLITAGTLGMIVTKGGERYILSNNHVLANSNNAQIGDAIYQPGPYDGGGAADTIGHLEDFAPIHFVGISDCPIANRVVNAFNFLAGLFGRKTRIPNPLAIGTNFVDAAIAKPVEAVSDEILEVGTPCGFSEVDIDSPIKKSGRTTGLTFGAVTVMDATVSVTYDTNIAVFEDQIITSAHCEGGDSGSIGLTEDNHVFGLLFAGSETTSIFNKIQNVIDALELV